MIPVVLAATMGWGAVTAPPPPLFLTGYQRPQAAREYTIAGPVAQHETRMFRIERQG